MPKIAILLAGLLLSLVAHAAVDKSDKSGPDRLKPHEDVADLFFMTPKTDREQVSLFWQEVRLAWAAGDYKKLELLGAAVASPAKPLLLTASGRPMLYQYATDLSRLAAIQWDKSLNLHRDSNGADCDCPVPDPAHYAQASPLWDAIGARYDAWLKLYPQSPYALVAKAQYLLNRGWFYRGAGYGNTIPQEALPIFSENVEAARKLLFSTYEHSSRNPEFYAVMFTIAGIQQWNPSRFGKLMADFNRNGRDYLTAATRAMAMMQPRWGGSYEAMDQFAVAVGSHNTEAGQDLYTRLYWTMSGYLQRSMFRDSLASWPRMRTGFEDMIRVYPDPLNLNAYAYFACMAGDFPVVASMLDNLGGAIMRDVWSDGSYSWCKQHAGR